MTSGQLESLASLNLRAIADRIDAGEVKVSRFQHEDTGNVVIYGPGPFDRHREQTLSIRFMPQTVERQPAFLSGETLAALDPGIRDLVNGLNVAGFKTTDSGDGCSKAAAIAAGEALPFRHVACVVSRDALFSEADRLLAVLGAGWTVEASYHPPEGQCVLFAREESPDVPGDQPPPVDALNSSAVAPGIVTVSHGAAQRCASGHNYRRNAPPQEGDVCYVCRSAVWRRGMAPHEGEPHDMAADPGLD